MIAIGTPSRDAPSSWRLRWRRCAHGDCPESSLPPPPRRRWEREVDVVVVGSGAAGLAAALAVRPVRSALIVTKGDARRRLDGVGPRRPRRRARPHRLAGEPRPRHARRRRRAVRRGRRPRARRRGADGDPLPDAPRRRLRSGGARRRRPGARPRGRAQPPSHRPLGRRPQRRRGAADARPVGARRRRRGARAGVRPRRRSSARRRTGSARPPASAWRCSTPTGSVASVGVVRARAVVLATGGYGQVFASTSNPPAVTGDGVAIAMRAGLDVSDVEFVQFHPTVMWSGPDAAGQQALVSEAVRGEGAILYDGAGQPGDGRRPPAGGPRTARRRRRGDQPHGWRRHPAVSATTSTSTPRRWASGSTSAFRRSPRRAASIGVDPARQRIPVAPAAHYACGGVPAKLDGTTALAGLYAVGEVSCTGVHGANRWRRTASPRASSPAPDSAATWPGSCPPRSSPTREPRRAARARRPRPQVDDPHDDVAPRRRAPRRRRARRGRGGARRRSSPRSRRDWSRRRRRPTRRPTWRPSPARCSPRPTARTESRGCHRRSDHPEPTAGVGDPPARRAARRRRTLEPVTVVGGPRPTAVAPLGSGVFVFHPLVDGDP